MAVAGFADASAMGVAPDAEGVQVDAVEAKGLAADPGGEEVVDSRVAVRRQGCAVAGDVEVELAVGQVAVGAGQARSRGELALVGWVVEGGLGLRILKQLVQDRVRIGRVWDPANWREIERFAGLGQA